MSLVIKSGLPASFWGKAVNTANYIRNRCPSRSLQGRTPFEKWTDKVPDVSHLQPFGTSVYTLDRSPTKGKLESRSTRGILVGYSEETKGYRIWLPEDKKVDIARDVKFLPYEPDQPGERLDVDLLETDSEVQVGSEEGVATFPPPVDDDGSPEHDVGGDKGPEDATDRDEDTSDDDNAELNQDDERRGRGRPRLVRTGGPGRPRKQYTMHRRANAVEEAFVAEVPLREAISGPNSSEWLCAIVTEMRNILKNDTWVLTSRPTDAKVIGSRIVLRNKYAADGTIERRKVRVVARGFVQRPGVDFMSRSRPLLTWGPSAQCWR